jgi:hypothetical protein
MGDAAAEAATSDASTDAPAEAATSDGGTDATDAAAGRSCLFMADGMDTACREYLSGWSEANVANDCKNKGTRVASCPTAGVIGKCSNATSGIFPPINIYYYPGFTGGNTGAAANCTAQQGTYQATN